MEPDGWPTLQWERFKGESLRAYQRRAREIQEIMDGFRMGRFRGDVAEQMEQRLVQLQERVQEPQVLSA